MNIAFTEEEINGLFGDLAAEDEPQKRFKTYFLKNDAYNKIHNFLPLRILVAHKGIGKSAVFRMSYLDNIDNNVLSLWIKPDDIADLGNGDSSHNPLELIRLWKNGLNKRIIDLLINNYDLHAENEDINMIVKSGIKIVDKISTVFKKANELFELDPIKKKALEYYIKNNRIVVYIDDLDRAWNGSRENIIRIAALLNAVRDMSNEAEGLCFRISLRSDVYYLVRTADESTDKIDGNVLWLNWNEHQLLVLLAKRVQVYFGQQLSEKELLKMQQFMVAKHLHCIMDEIFEGDGKWNNRPIHYIFLSLIRRRPRDLINLCTLAARNANENGHKKIRTDDWEEIFSRYSLSRLQDTINEHRYELPEIERLLLGMKPSKGAKKMSGSFMYDENKLLQKISGIMQKRKFEFYNGKEATAKELLAFMYKINFIVARKDAADGYIDRKYFEEHKYLATDFVDFAYRWEVHPAFRWALYPEAKSVVNDIDLPSLL